MTHLSKSNGGLKPRITQSPDSKKRQIVILVSEQDKAEILLDLFALKCKANSRKYDDLWDEIQDLFHEYETAWVSLPFNTDLCDLFFEDYSSDFVKFADDTTPYACEPTHNEVMNNVEITTEKVFEWFSFNNLKVNASICHLFISP